MATWFCRGPPRIAATIGLLLAETHISCRCPPAGPRRFGRSPRATPICCWRPMRRRFKMYVGALRHAARTLNIALHSWRRIARPWWMPSDATRAATRRPRMASSIRTSALAWRSCCPDKVRNGSAWHASSSRANRYSETALERCQQAAKPFIDWSILDQLAAEPGSDVFRLDQIDVIQPVLVAIAIAYAELLKSLGVRPDAVVGHSMGEVGAAYIAGVLDLDQAMRVICRRSALLRRVSGQGAMALVELPMAEVRERLTEVADLVSLAASNSPRSSVISGQPEAVRRVMAELEADGVFCRLVKVDVASHSPQMAPLAAELAEDLAAIEPAACQIPIYSTALGRRPEGHEFGAEYWATNLRQPVLFSTAIRSLSDDGVTIFVELGPHPVLLPSIQQTAPAAITLACGRKDEGQETTLLTVLAGLLGRGLSDRLAARHPRWRA